MIDRVAGFIEKAVFFRIGLFFLRVVSLGRIRSWPDSRRQSRVIVLGVLITVGVLEGTGLWLSPSSHPQPGRNLFDTRAEFQAYVSRLDLAAVPTIYT